MIRLALLVGLGGLIWIIAGSQVQTHERLPLSAVVPEAAMTQPFGCTSFALEPFDPFCPGLHIHTGVDLAAPEGTAVHAATSGTAHIGYDAQGAGLYVVVTADSHVRELYCHLSTAVVANGDAVTTGEVIGAIGVTGLTTGAHLHFEVQIDGRSVDPAVWLAS